MGILSDSKAGLTQWPKLKIISQYGGIANNYV